MVWAQRDDFWVEWVHSAEGECPLARTPAGRRNTARQAYTQHSEMRRCRRRRFCRRFRPQLLVVQSHWRSPGVDFDCCTLSITSPVARRLSSTSPFAERVLPFRRDSDAHDGPHCRPTSSPRRRGRRSEGQRLPPPRGDRPARRVVGRRRLAARRVLAVADSGHAGPACAREPAHVHLAMFGATTAVLVPGPEARGRSEGDGRRCVAMIGLRAPGCPHGRRDVRTRPWRARGRLPVSREAR